jgi:tetratricopeptide (TPR) repeat protein
MLSARIDRLPPAEKDLLQTLAVIGKEPELKLIEGVTAKGADELEPMLSNLQLSEFIYEQPTLDGPAYTFKHALTQEVAFNSILDRRRRLIHEKTARAIEALFEEQLEDHYSELARHHLQGTDTARAVHYAQLAAEQALLRGTYAEATSLIEAALKLLNRLPEGNERLRAELALRGIESTIAFVQYGGGSHERERAISRMCELGEKLGEADQLLRGLTMLCNLYFVRGESVRGLEHANRCVELSAVGQHARLLVDAHFVAGALAFSCGKLREAVSHLEGAALLSRRIDHQVSIMGFHYRSLFPCMLAGPLQLLGRFNEALSFAEEGLRQARESGHLFMLGLVLVIKAHLAHHRREWEVALAHSEETIALSEDNGFTAWLNMGRFNRGWSLAELGQLEQGIIEMETAIDGIRRSGGAPMLQYLITVLAQAHARMGQSEKGLVIMNEALQQTERTGEKDFHAEMLRLKGEMVLMHDAERATEAERYFRAALEVARGQEAKWWELRTSVSLARLLRDADRLDEARIMLAEVYNWFTEGFDLPDLKDAKTLLRELGGTLQ